MVFYGNYWFSNYISQFTGTFFSCLILATYLLPNRTILQRVGGAISAAFFSFFK
jgi:hypothetical protein